MQTLSARSSAAGYQENDADEQAMSELVESLKDAIVEYQVSPDPVIHRVPHLSTMQFAQQNSLHEKGCKLIVRPGWFV